jgi:hypothetical protein
MATVISFSLNHCHRSQEKLLQHSINYLKNDEGHSAEDKEIQSKLTTQKPSYMFRKAAKSNIITLEFQ